MSEPAHVAMANLTVDGPLILAGCGKMGSALLHGWLRAGLAPDQVTIVETDAARRSMLPDGVEACADASQIRDGIQARLLLLAVKPQVMGEVAPQYRRLLSRKSLVVSIAAGTPIATFEAAFGADQPIVRIMPNTPAAVGAGMSVLCANDHVDDQDRHLATALMRAVGDTAWISNEDDMHAVTALSGSGPAYVFHLVEAMAAAAEALGLQSDLAMHLARTTVCGAGALMDRDVGKASELRINVTSPGGTTQAALEVLMNDDRMVDLLKEAIGAAAARSRALS